ncbi:MAG: PhnD/SsuA/transferrin family substrate-binding protein [Gammaproteobacteria bacterium]|nr:PhnD/SsuA/transferrin family substrate-binding protein [Gammaproteobacteria bacterium]
MSVKIKLVVCASPPRETAARGEELYAPLAQLLSDQLGVPVVYKRARDWIEYSTSMKQDKYDIIFDGPHFAAWRMKHLGHTPVAKLPGELSFVVVSYKDDKKHNRMRDLINGPLCALASPNLGTMAVLAQFTNPLIQPDLYEVSNITEVYEKFKSGKCKAAVFQDKFFNKLPVEEKAHLKVMFTSGHFPDQTVTVSKRVTDRQRAVLTELLTRPSGIAATQELLKQYTKQAKRFDSANPQEFTGLEALLEGVLWGW